MDEKLLEDIARKSMELAGKASRGPWKRCSCGKCGVLWGIEADIAIGHTTGPEDQEVPLPAEVRDANSDFIEFARMALPLLAAKYLEACTDKAGKELRSLMTHKKS